MNLLRALIVSYTRLVSSLLAPPPSLVDPAARLPDGSPVPTEPERLVQHIRLIAINMHHLINELRPVQVSRAGSSLGRSGCPDSAGSATARRTTLTVCCGMVQARETLKGMMRAQIDQRRAKTAAIRE